MHATSRKPADSSLLAATHPHHQQPQHATPVELPTRSRNCPRPDVQHRHWRRILVPLQPSEGPGGNEGGSGARQDEDEAQTPAKEGEGGYSGGGGGD